MRGWVSLLIAAFAIVLTSGCSKKANDAKISADIKSQIVADPQLQDASLKVSSTNGQVTLTGSVPSDAARYDAFKLVSQTPGVLKVNDQLSVEAPQTSDTQIDTNAPVATAPAANTDPARQSPAKHTPMAANQTQIAQNTTPLPQAPAPPPAEAAPIDAAPIQPPVPPAPALPPQSSPVPPPPKEVEVAPGTTLTIRMIDSIDSSVNKAGELFHASLDTPVIVDNEVVVPRGADVYVRLSSASSAGHVTGQSQLHLELVKLEFQGSSYPLVSGTYSVAGKSRSKDSAEKIGGGAVVGAIIGAIAGGGKGAAIGAGVGGGAGGIYQEATKGKSVKIPAETQLDFQLDQPVTVTVMQHPNDQN